MNEKILQLDVEKNLFVNNVKTNILLLKIAKEAGYEKVNITLVGLDPKDSPYTEPLTVEQALTEQEEYLEFILKSINS